MLARCGKTIVNVRSDIGDTWFVTMESEEDALATVLDIRTQKIQFQVPPHARRRHSVRFHEPCSRLLTHSSARLPSPPGQADQGEPQDGDRLKTTRSDELSVAAAATRVSREPTQLVALEL